MLQQSYNIDSVFDRASHPARQIGSNPLSLAPERSIDSFKAKSNIFEASKSKKLVTIGHSYCVTLNRRLGHEIARVSEGAWEVTVVAPSSFQGDLGPIVAQPLEGEACTLESIPAYLKRRPHFFFYGARLREILRFPWDMVHCWEEPYVFAGAQVAWLKNPKSAFVFWSYQNVLKHYPPPFSQLERFCLNRCDGWIASGVSVECTLTERGYDCRPHKVLPLGVDLDAFRPDPESRRLGRERLGWPDSTPPVVGFLGRFVEGKGLRLLIRALDRLSSWRALLVGGGPLEKELRDWAARHGDRVRIVTGVGHAEVAAYLNAMDVLCAPSQTTATWREQFGRMLIEAFACGIPIIASDSGEIPHVVGDAGLLIGEKDESGWQSAIAGMIADRERRSEFGARGLERAKSTYAWPVVAQRHIDFFDQLIEARRSRAASGI